MATSQPGVLARYGSTHTFQDQLRTCANSLLRDFHAKLGRQLAQQVIAMGRETSGTLPGFDLSFDLKPAPPPMGDSATELLREASKDQQGIIMSIQTLQGSHVQTNGKNYASAGNARSDAQWRGAVDELGRLGLIEDRSGKGEVFFVTDEGYRVADVLQQQQLDFFRSVKKAGE